MIQCWPQKCLRKDRTELWFSWVFILFFHNFTFPEFHSRYVHLLLHLLIPSGNRGISLFIKTPVQCISAKYDGTGIESPVCLGFHFITEQLGKTEHIYIIYLVSPHLRLPPCFPMGHERTISLFPRWIQLFLVCPGAGIEHFPLLCEGRGGCAVLGWGCHCSGTGGVTAMARQGSALAGQRGGGDGRKGIAPSAPARPCSEGLAPRGQGRGDKPLFLGLSCPTGVSLGNPGPFPQHQNSLSPWLPIPALPQGCCSGGRKHQTGGKVLPVPLDDPSFVLAEEQRWEVEQISLALEN